MSQSVRGGFSTFHYALRRELICDSTTTTPISLCLSSQPNTQTRESSLSWSNAGLQSTSSKCSQTPPASKI